MFFVAIAMALWPFSLYDRTGKERQSQADI